MASSKKFGRQFRLIIQTNAGVTDESKMEFIAIENPFTLEFSLNRDVKSSLNKMQCKIHNLSFDTRNKIFKDRFSDKYKRVILQAGYDKLVTIFQGNIFSAYSSRNGADIVTSLDCQDGGYDTSTAAMSFTANKGTDTEGFINSIVNSFKVITKGAIGGNNVEKKRATSYNGQSYNLLGQETAGYFIDNEKLYVLKDGEVTNRKVLIFNSETGLLDVPERQNTYITINVLFEPSAHVAQVVQVESAVETKFNGQFKVIGLQHSGTISDTMGGSLTTTLSLMMPDLLGGWKTVKEDNKKDGAT